MKRILPLLFVLVTSAISYAQTNITGKITDQDGKAVASASVTVEEPGKDAIMAYSISNASGEYKITFTSAAPNVELKVKAFNQKPQTKTLKNESQTSNFKLEDYVTEIKEVKLKTKLITKKGDTIAYDLKAFESKADRTLADVLKKIPGIDVNKDGTILYQGEAINKFYVEGKDLMEGGYGTINNSLPKDAVQKIEVMENHQPVKILQDKVPSDKAALNIKLKKSVTMTGRGEVGLGLDPLLWNVKLTPMLFSKKNQWVLNYKTNNNGESVENEGRMLAMGMRWEGMRRQASQNSWLNIESASTPNLPEKRYLMNNVHYFSANLLTNPFTNKDWELKANASYTNNAVSREAEQITVYQQGSTVVPAGGTFVSKTANNFYTNAAKGELIFSKNAKKGFFKNTTTWNGYWNDANANVNNTLPPVAGSSTPQNRLGDELLNSPTGSIQNSLSTIIPWKEKLFNVMSYISYQKDRQTMDINPASYVNYNGNFPEADHYETLRQYAESKTLTANHSVSVGFSYKKWTFTPEMGINLSFNEMISNLSGKQNNAFVGLGQAYENKIKWDELQPYTQVGINYKSGALNMNMTIPMNFYSIRYRDLLNNNVLDKTKTAFEPNFFASLDFASFFKIWAFGSQSYDFGNFGYFYGGQILTSPTGLTLRYGPNMMMPENLSRNLGTRLEYRNPLNNLFFNVGFNYNNNKRNLMEKYVGNGFTSSLELIAEENTTSSKSERAEIGKYFPKFKTNASFNFNNSDSKSFSYFNSLQETAINRQTLGFKFNNTYFSWLSVDYNISMNWANNKNLTGNTSVKTSGWSHNLAAYLYPLENHTIGFFWDDMTTKANNNNFNNAFFDISYQYTWAKKKIDFEIKWLNIANKKTYETISYNPQYLSTTTNLIYIRPSQVMFTVKFNFK